MNALVSHRGTHLRGFTLLTAIILSSVVLSLGLALLDVAYKQLLLAASTKQSQYAFYAADSALECALYYDNQRDFFGSNPFGLVPDDVTCDDAAVAFDTLRSGTSPSISEFIASFGEEAVCATVTVYKNNPSPPRTIIYANGFNTCNDTDPRRVERGLKITF